MATSMLGLKHWANCLEPILMRPIHMDGPPSLRRRSSYSRGASARFDSLHLREPWPRNTWSLREQRESEVIGHRRLELQAWKSNGSSLRLGSRKDILYLPRLHDCHSFQTSEQWCKIVSSALHYLYQLYKPTDQPWLSANYSKRVDEV